MKKFKHSTFLLSDNNELGKMLSILLSIEHIELTYALKSDIIPPSSIVIIDLDTHTIPKKSFGALIGISSTPEALSNHVISSCRKIFPRPFSFKALTEAVIDACEESLSDGASNAEPIPVFKLHKEDNIVIYGKKTLRLTPSESSILALLLKKRGEIVTYGEISEAVGVSDSNKSTVFVCNLRKKLDAQVGITPICTIRQKGYMIK